MTILKKTLSLCLVLIVVVGLFGCGMMQQAVDSADPESDQLLTAFLDALGSNDANAAYQLMFPGSVDQSDFDDHWAVLTRDWGMSVDYTFQKVNVKTTISTGGKYVDNVYIVKRPNRYDYVINLSRAESGGQSGITYMAIEILLATFGGAAY
jgi:hypothetical protein